MSSSVGGGWGDEVRGGGRVLIRYGVCVFSTKRSREGREKLRRKEIKGAEQTRGIHKIYKMPISRLRFRSTLLDCKGARCSCEKIKSLGREGKGEILPCELALPRATQLLVFCRVFTLRKLLRSRRCQLMRSFKNRLSDWRAFAPPPPPIDEPKRAPATRGYKFF